MGSTSRKRGSPELRSIIRAMAETPTVTPSEDFVDRVMSRLREESVTSGISFSGGSGIEYFRFMGSGGTIDARDCAFCFFAASIWYLLLGMGLALGELGYETSTLFGDWVRFQPLFFSASAMIFFGLGILVLRGGARFLDIVRGGITLFLILGIGNGLFGHLIVDGGRAGFRGMMEFLIGSVSIGLFLNVMVTFHQRYAIMEED